MSLQRGARERHPSMEVWGEPTASPRQKGTERALAVRYSKKAHSQSARRIPTMQKLIGSSIKTRMELRPPFLCSPAQVPRRSKTGAKEDMSFVLCPVIDLSTGREIDLPRRRSLGSPGKTDRATDELGPRPDGQTGLGFTPRAIWNAWPPRWYTPSLSPSR